MKGTKTKRKRIPKPPNHYEDFSPGARKLWNKTVVEYEILDYGGLAALEIGCLAYTRMEKVQEIINREGETIRDRFGVTKPHPLLGIEKDCRNQVLRAFQLLGLSMGGDDGDKDPGGRPPGPYGAYSNSKYNQEDD